MQLNPASFRDPHARVYDYEGRVLREVSNNKKEFFLEFLDSDFYRQLRGKSIVETDFVNFRKIEKNKTSTDTFFLEHEKIEFITYPHEWCFETLKEVAIFHLNLQKKALDSGFFLKDASPYNVQFKNGKPIFIDLLSFESYHEGDYWVAYKQFCDNFLNPLVIRSHTGIEHNMFFRGSIDGVDARLTSAILPLKSWFSFKIISHIHIRAWLEKKVDSSSPSQSISSRPGISKKNIQALWESLEIFIKKLSARDLTYWSEYENNNSYVKTAVQIKDNLVRNFINKYKPNTLLDLGCNRGRFCRIAFESGASKVIGLDIDGSAVDKANLDYFLRSRDFIALQFDLMNPSPAIGWQNIERSIIWDRMPRIDTLICLALVHHICISKNVPLGDFVKFLFNLSKTILVEFVPKTDSMVQGLLSNRSDIFDDYNEENFERELSKHGHIIEKRNIKDSSRTLYECVSSNF